MKIIIKILLFTTINVFSQKGIVYYVKAYENPKEITQNKLMIFNDIRYKLLFSNNRAIMKLEENMNLDDITIRRFVNKGGGKGLYFKDINDKVRIHEVEFNDELLTIIKSFKSYNWELLNETKKICGFTCYKAIAKIEVVYPITNEKKIELITAWYTPNINVSFGPIDRDGLPGLVLETSFKNIYYIAQKVILNPKKSIKIIKPNNGLLISDDEYQKRVNSIVDLIKSKFNEKNKK
jgi:GLPGLI family protein